MRAHLLLITLLASSLPGQFDNPETKIKEIVDDVAKQMQEIDDLLLKTRPESLKSAAEGMQKATEKIDDLLNQTGKSQGQVVNKIEELIQEIQKLQGQSGGQGQGQPQQQSRDRQQRGQQQRQESPTPEMQQDEPQQNPRDGRDQKGAPRNVPSKPRPDDPTEKIAPRRDAEAWGTLPMYEQLKKTRGGAPEVPEKYRKFHDAFLKSQNRESKSGR